jgi:hypothetical protein
LTAIFVVYINYTRPLKRADKRCSLPTIIRDIEGLSKYKTSDVYTTGTRPLYALLDLQQFDASWGRNLFPGCMLSNAEGELPCWYPFATEQF